MKPAILTELTALVTPFDSPRTEAALLNRVRSFDVSECSAAAEQMTTASPCDAVVRLVFLRWLELDPDSATRALPGLDDRAACRAARALASRLVRRDAASARRWATSLADLSWNPESVPEMRPGVPNPFAGRLQRITGGGSPVERIVWETIITFLCSVSAEEALEAWREANAAGVTCPGLVPALIEAMADNPGMALSLIGELGDGEIAIEGLAAHARNVASRSPDEALTLISEMEAGCDRDRLLNHVLHAVPALVGRAYPLYSDSASDSEFITMKQAMAALGTEAAAQQMADYPELISWPRQAWEVFIALLEEPGEEAKVRRLLDQSLPAPVLSGAASALATFQCENSPNESAELLRRHGPADDYVVQIVAEALAKAEGMQVAAAFIAEMPGELQFAFSGAMRGAMARNPAEAMEWCRQNWDESQLTSPLRDGMWEWIKHDRDAAISWTLKHDDAPWRLRLLRIIIEHQAHKHPQWCAATITGEFQSNPAAAAEPVWIWLTALICTQWREARPREAMEWTTNLADSPARAAAILVISGNAHCADYRLQENVG